MAKRGVLEHEKTFDLAERLGIAPCYALGVLEAFWHWAAKYRTDGDITGLKPAMLASTIRYPGNGEDLMGSLIASGWIDQTSEKMVIHDWSEHADNAVHQHLKSRGELFADGSAPFSRNKRIITKQSTNEMNDLRDCVSDSPKGEEFSQKEMNGSPKNVSFSRLPEARSQKPLPDTNQNQNPSAPGVAAAVAKPAKVEPDPRHAACRELLERYWKHANHGLEMPWSASEAKALAELLRANPGLMPDQFHLCLRNRFKSDVAQSERPRKWLASAIDYHAGPLDRYGKPKAQGGADGAHGESPAIARHRRSVEGIRRAAEKLGIAPSPGVDGADEGELSGAGVAGGDVGNLDGGMGGDGAGVWVAGVPASAGSAAGEVDILSTPG